MIKKIYNSLLFITSLYACTQEVSLPFPSTAPQIVLNGILHPDSLISITLTKTLPVADKKGFPIVTDAVVRLYEDDRLLGNLMYQDSAYTLDYHPKEGHQYTVEVDVPTYPTLTASDVVPYAPIASACYKKDSTYSASDVGVQIEIQDQPLERNSYWLYIIDTPYDVSSCEIIGDSLLCPGVDSLLPYRRKMDHYQSYSPIPDRFNSFIDNISGGITTYEKYMRIDDASLNGAVITLDVTSLEIASYQYILENKYSFILNIMSSSQHYDRYLKSSMIYFLNHEYLNEANPFAEPTQIYSNIENGTGIFAAYNSVNIEVENYPCE